MRLSLHTDYALRTLLFLATKAGRASATDMAEFYQISRDHLAKVVQSLVRLGYVRSVRGMGGGVELRRTPDEITVGQVILDFEGNMNLLECVASDGVCVIQPGCRLRTVLATAEKIQLDYLQTVRLSSLIPPSGGGLLSIERAESARPAPGSAGASPSPAAPSPPSTPPVARLASTKPPRGKSRRQR